MKKEDFNEDWWKELDKSDHWDGFEPKLYKDGVIMGGVCISYDSYSDILQMMEELDKLKDTLKDNPEDFWDNLPRQKTEKITKQ